MRNRVLRLCGRLTLALGIFLTSAPLVLGDADDREELGFKIPSYLFDIQDGGGSWIKLREVLYLIGTRYYRPVPAEEIVKRMIDGGVASLDPHSSFMNAKEYAEMQTGFRGKFGGLGMEIQKNIIGGRPGILVVAPLDDTPAHAAGIKAKDVIQEIDGKSTRKMTAEEAANLIRGNVGTTVTLKIFREGEPELISITLTRAVIQIRYVKHELREGGLGIVRIVSFAGETVTQLVTHAVQKLTHENKGPLSQLVLDLRNNPGGLLGVANAVNDLFLDAKRYYPDPDYWLTTGRLCPAATITVSTESRGHTEPQSCINPYASDLVKGIPMVVLINAGSASASEIVAKTLQVYGRATVAGTSKSFGKGTVQTIFTLMTGGALRLTTSQYLIGPGGCEQVLQTRGVTPDLFITDPKEKSGSGDGEKWSEEQFSDAVAPSVISDANCQYRYEVPQGHKEAARNMLQKLGFTILEKIRETEELR
ncbi:MAG: S41 family peptidase [bacterium]|nr:S41 family peptidase [bacterium]